MKTSGFLAAALVLGGLAFSSAAHAGDDAEAKTDEGIAWTKDYEAAKAQAEKEGKGLLIYLTPDWFN
ncbi:MAG: hypothetical protein ACYTG4_05820 [Planctomycetota bacterium]|jgi:hypothetical protein